MPTMRVLAIVSTVAALALAGCGGNDSSKPPPEPPNTMQLQSPAFKDGAMLPKKYTCDGSLGGVNPPLDWSRRPHDLKSQALVVADPDAPGGTYVHWVIWGMMARTTGLEEDIPPIGLPAAKNSSGNTKYAPPCPPKGNPPHRYVFTIYALKAPLDAKNGSPAGEAIDKIKKDALARGTITGKYSR